MVPGIQVDDNTLFRKKAVKNGIFMGTMPWTVFYSVLLRYIPIQQSSIRFFVSISSYILHYAIAIAAQATYDTYHSLTTSSPRLDA